MFRRLALLSFLAFAPAHAFAQAKPRTPQQISDSTDIASLAHSLTRNARTDSARAAALYEWVGRHVAYDIAGYFAGRLNDVNAEHVYRKRIAVCGGFVTLYQRMASEVGLEVTPILGYAKGFDYKRGKSTRKPNHSWAAVRIGGSWRLIDPTWAAGVIVSGRFQPSFTWDYFLVDPDALILSHYPKESEWQLLARSVSRSDFERMPVVPRVVVNAGFTPAAIRLAALHSGLRDFPLIGVRDRSRARVISAPIAGTLKGGARVAVDILWPGASEVALVSGGVWTHLRRDGDHFRGEAPATKATLQVVGRTRADAAFETLLQYTVQ